VTGMTDDEVREAYPNLLDVLVQVCRALLPLPLAQMASVNETMQTLAPIVEPTAYMRGGMENLRDQRRVIDAAANLHRVLRDFDPEANR
jgi:hypothetical protein